MNLKDLRIYSGLKAKKIAELLGVSRVQLYYYENNKSKINEERLKELSKIYRVPYKTIKGCVEGNNGEKGD